MKTAASRYPFSLDRLYARGWFSSQPAEFQQRVLEAAVPRSFERGETIYAMGDPPCGIYGLAEGSIRILLDTRFVDPILVHIAPAGFWIGDFSVIIEAHRRVSVESATPTHFVFIPLPKLKSMIDQSAEDLRRFAEISLQNLRGALYIIENMSIADPKKRVCATILTLAYTIEEIEMIIDGGHFNEEVCRVSQSELGEISNTSRQGVNGVLQDLVRQGTVKVGYGSITVVKPQALVAIISGTRANDGTRLSSA